MIRLFVALALPEDVRRRLEMLRGGFPGARWQSAEQMHLTLRFIGEVDGAAFREIGDALAHIEAEPFSLTLEGVGHFPHRGRVRILWAGVVQNPALMRLRERTEAVITGLGFEPDGRNYAPHVTLARFASRVAQHRLQEFISYHGPYTSGPFPVRSFELFSSHLGAGGAHYAVEASYPLGPVSPAD